MLTLRNGFSILDFIPPNHSKNRRRFSKNYSHGGTEVIQTSVDIMAHGMVVKTNKSNKNRWCFIFILQKRRTKSLGRPEDSTEWKTVPYGTVYTVIQFAIIRKVFAKKAGSDSQLYIRSFLVSPPNRTTTGDRPPLPPFANNVMHGPKIEGWKRASQSFNIYVPY